MPARSSDLHGDAPDTCPVALVLIDVINDLEFPGGRELLRTALPAASRIARLAHRAREAAIPVIYANDNFGRWRSDFREVVEHCLHDDVRGRPIAELLAPKREDYFVLKPKHSAFYSTTLATLLAYLEVKRLVLTGFAGEACVLVSAADAYMIRAHYPDLFRDEPRELTRALALCERTYELADFLANVAKIDAVPGTFHGTITYHDACSGLRELGVKSQPRALLAKTEGLKLVEMKSPEQCCGFGGTFSVKFGDISSHIADRKCADIVATGADAVVLGDLGCMGRCRAP